MRVESTKNTMRVKSTKNTMRVKSTKNTMRVKSTKSIMKVKSTHQIGQFVSSDEIGGHHCHKHLYTTKQFTCRYGFPSPVLTYYKQSKLEWEWPGRLS